jgi:RNA polymerase sigma-70 factor (ECF subfamily)
MRLAAHAAPGTQSVERMDDDHAPGTPPDAVSRLVAAAQAGDRDAEEALVDVVYDELRRVARRYMRRERTGHTLQPTGLVHEAWARLLGGRDLDVANRAHFLAIAANAMRQILVERARAHRAAKRGGGAARVTLEDDMAVQLPAAQDVEALDEALRALEASEPELGRIVHLRFFGGLTVEETAAHMGLSPATVKRRWTLARAWLLRRMEGTSA